MPVVPVAACETYSKGKEQPNHEDSWEHLSAEEKLAAEESLSLYCKPVEFYNYLRLRAIEKPLFLQRCLDYRIKAKRKKRFLMTVSLLWKDYQTRPLFPLCICLARLDPNGGAEGAQKYHVGQIFTFQGPSAIDGNGNAQVQVNFLLPELDKLAVEANSGKYFVLVFASEENPISLSGVNASPMPLEVASNESSGGENCLYGKVSLKTLYQIWDSNPNFPVGLRVNIQPFNFLPCILTYYLQFCFRRKIKSISIQDSRDSRDVGKLNEQLSVCVQELGAREKSPCQSHASREVASMSSSLSHILRLKEGNVSFNYRYYNNKLQRTEVTEDFSCPFCLVPCATYKGLRWHLVSSHDFFNFEFSESEDCPSVYVSMKTNIWKLEIIADDVDPRLQTFLFCAKPPKRKELKNVSHGRANNTDQLLSDPEIPTGDTELLENTDGSSAIILHPGPDCVPSIFDHDTGTHAMLQIDHEGVSKAIILHPGLDCVPSISDHDNGTRAMLQIDHEGVSNAIILRPGLDCVPSISDHDNGTRAMLQIDHEGVSNAIILHPGLDCVPSISDHDNGTRAMLQIDHEGVSNAITLHPGLDCVPSISDQDNGTLAMLQVDHEGVSNAIVHPGPDCVPSISKHDHGTPAVPQVGKKEMLPIEHYDPKIVARLEKRKFYHSHKYQPMELEEVLLDEDSEDEINEGVQEIEDRRRLAILDATDDEKQFLSLWNSFIQKHRVLADGHMNWAYEAFTKYHCAEFVQSPALAWQWAVLMTKLVKHGLLKACTISKCCIILEQYRKLNSDRQKLKKIQF